LTISRKSVEKIQVSLKSKKITSTVREDQYIFMITPRSIFLRMRSVSDSFTENQNALKNRAVYELM